MTPADVKTIRSWQKQGNRIVLVTGVFDLLHIEHLRFLDQAKAQGDKLIVGIETDQRVKTIKGHSRPFNPQSVRLDQLSALKAVDLAFVLPETFSHPRDWEDFMRLIHPDIYAVSANTAYLDNKQTICQTCGVSFRIVHAFNPEYSSTKILHKLHLLE